MLRTAQPPPPSRRRRLVLAVIGTGLIVAGALAIHLGEDAVGWGLLVFGVTLAACALDR